MLFRSGWRCTKKLLSTDDSVFHEALAPLGDSTADKPVISAIWHEAVAGRSGYEVAAAVLHLLSAPQLSSVEY